MKLKNVIKVANKFSKKVGMTATVFLPSGKYTESLVLRNGVQLGSINDNERKN